MTCCEYQKSLRKYSLLTRRVYPVDQGSAQPGQVPPRGGGPAEEKHSSLPLLVRLAPGGEEWGCQDEHAQFISLKLATRKSFHFSRGKRVCVFGRNLSAEKLEE